MSETPLAAEPSGAAAVAAADGAHVAITRTAQGRYAVAGALTFATARRALATGLDAFAAAPAGPIEVDCSAVRPSDSAGLAVLIEWLAWARRSGRELRYSGVPDAICAIARLSEIEELLVRR